MEFFTEGEKARLEAYKASNSVILSHIDDIYRSASHLSKDNYVDFLIRKGGVNISDPKDNLTTIGFNDDKGTTVYISNNGIVKIELLGTGVRLLTNTKPDTEIILSEAGDSKAGVDNNVLDESNTRDVRDIPGNIPFEIQELVLSDSNKDGILQSKEAVDLLGVIISHEIADGVGEFSKQFLNDSLEFCHPEASDDIREKFTNNTTEKLSNSLNNIKKVMRVKLRAEDLDKIVTDVGHIEWEDVCNTLSNFTASHATPFDRDEKERMINK